jgi:hypothetical protein
MGKKSKNLQLYLKYERLGIFYHITRNVEKQIKYNQKAEKIYEILTEDEREYLRNRSVELEED